MNPVDDTICAIATPIGEGGIGIVRVSGEKALDIVSGLVQLHSARRLQEIKSHTLYRADVIDPASPRPVSPGSSCRLDEALVVVMRAPHSYTGEDTVELHCHGGPLLLQTLCEILISRGARLAEPGEFTKRAFLNERLNLTQAEAVLDTIRAKTAGSLRLAQEQLRGSLSEEIDRRRESLIGLLAHVEAGIDFVEEEIAFIRRDELAQELEQVRTAVARLADSSREGRILREGISAAIVGRPNVGKSSLLNALLQTDRAIVTPVPGTTRDVLEEVLNIRGVPVRLLDTAGVRDTDDPVEHEGIKRSRGAMEQADLLLVLLDGSDPLDAEDRILLTLSQERKRIVVINKTDLPSRIEPAEVAAHAPVVFISAKTGEGLKDLRDVIRNTCLRADLEPGDSPMVTRLRHQANLVRAQESIAQALESVQQGLPGEFIALDIRGALDALGEITGAVTTDEILERIFQEFCIGK